MDSRTEASFQHQLLDRCDTAASGRATNTGLGKTPEWVSSWNLRGRQARSNQSITATVEKMVTSEKLDVNGPPERFVPDITTAMALRSTEKV